MPRKATPVVVGRDREKHSLDSMLASPEAELLAIYGRRRVGKTHLIRQYLEPRVDVFFSVTGEKGGPLRTQLHSFQRELERVFFQGAPIARLTSWREAFDLLCGTLEHRAEARSNEQVVVFLDELPWLATRKSGLLGGLDHAWNTRLSRLRGLRLVVCGSAASWMLDKLVHATGGLHNRITRRIRLEPFSLEETREYLAQRGIRSKPQQVIELYMAVGGIPYYLRQMERGRSAAQNIAATCFDPNGVLIDEYERVFESLFSSAHVHREIVQAIATKRKGISRAELTAVKGLSSGGRLARRLRELEEAGFIAGFAPYGHRSRNTHYRLIDPYTWFYLKWIAGAPKRVLAAGDPDYWLRKVNTPSYRAWAGYAFENVCLNHAVQIRRALGIGAVSAEVGTWRYTPSPGIRDQHGAQVDLLFDRDDGVINLCEIKYSSDDFKITKAYARELMRKIDVFEERTKTKKDVRLTLVTTHGLEPTVWSRDLIDSVVTADDLFA